MQLCFMPPLRSPKSLKYLSCGLLKNLSPSASLETIRGICRFQEARLWRNMSTPFSFQKPCCDGSAFLECSIMSVLKPDRVWKGTLPRIFKYLLGIESFPNQITTMKYIKIHLSAKVTCKVFPRNTSRNLRINNLLTKGFKVWLLIVNFPNNSSNRDLRFSTPMVLPFQTVETPVPFFLKFTSSFLLSPLFMLLSFYMYNQDCQIGKEQVTNAISHGIQWWEKKNRQWEFMNCPVAQNESQPTNK